MAPEPSVEDLHAEIARLREQGEALQARVYELQTAERIHEGEDVEYARLRQRIREAVRTAVPAEAVVLVVSKGDSLLTDLYGREAWHFPRQDDGRYSGFYPKRDLSAIAHLEAMRACGAGYLLLPETSRWWLDHYADFHRYLERRYSCVFDETGTGAIYAIVEVKEPQGAVARLERFLDEALPILGADPPLLDWTGGAGPAPPPPPPTGFAPPRPAPRGAAPPLLDWTGGAGLAAALPDRTVFAPPRAAAPLPYLDASVDLVAVAGADPAALKEAERVASGAVLDLAALERDEPTWLRWQSAPPETAVPSVSIIVPCHNGWALTAACLRTLRETLPAWFRGEIVVVDDKSTDETSHALKELVREDGRLRVVRNRANKGFLASCNRGAAEARGDYLLFLNNDTVLLVGWLGPLLATFGARPDAGVVGGKLLFEDGRLQEAGGLVYSDASASKIGYLDPDVEAPFYQHVREVDYVSGAFLMTPRALFAEIGGLDPRYGFGYYDDDDYCFAVRAAGRKVYLQPESVIV